MGGQLRHDHRQRISLMLIRALQSSCQWSSGPGLMTSCLTALQMQCPRYARKALHRRSLSNCLLKSVICNWWHVNGSMHHSS
jgi:hypothetical protein